MVKLFNKPISGLFRFFIITIILSATSNTVLLAQVSSCNIIAYYAGGPSNVANIHPADLTHIIYSFCYSRGNKFIVTDTTTVKRLVTLKRQNPKLKVLLSFAGWEGCRNCSEVFSKESNRKAFAGSVKAALVKLKADGIDLDWEYPAIAGQPGQRYKPEDRENFTALLKALRDELGYTYELSFAAGAFTEYLERSVEWEKVAPLVDRINLMTYDLVNGYSTVTGHHTALYSTPHLKESGDRAVKFLLAKGLPANKLVLGAAFYGRVWQNVAGEGGLYQPAKFRNTVGIKTISQYYTERNGYQYFWDDTARAPYLYNRERRLFVTFDDNRSVQLKAKYVLENKLNGIMFWQIALDKQKDSLLETIVNTLKNK